jgi:hypothetical protein
MVIQRLLMEAGADESAIAW